MNCILRYCGGWNDISFRTLLPRIFAQQLREKRSYVDKKKLQIQNSRLQKKSYEADPGIFNPTKPLLLYGRKSDCRKLPQARLIREQNLSSLIRNEIQALIEGGQVGSELQEYHITLTKAYMVSPKKCRILWKPDFPSKDLEILKLLNRSSKKISHLLRTHYIVNNAPELDFFLDPELLNIAKVEELLNKCDIDSKPDSLNEEETTEALNESKVAEKALYDLDYESLHSKLIVLKKGNSSIT